MLDIAPPRFRVEEENDRHGQFVAEPLPRGLGHTLGNSLRRVMLSGLEGAAVTKVRIEGVSHEFSTIPGVKEDVVDIILNLKDLKFILERDEPVELEVIKSGPGEVTAADIDLKADVEFVDEEAYIATVSEGGTLEMRAGARTDLDSLSIEVFTDGRIRPRQALQEAARQLMDILGLFTNGYEGPRAAAPNRVGRNVINDERPVEDLELTVRSYNCLKREGVDTIGQLATMTEEELMNIRNLGMKSVDEIRSKLIEYGYQLESEGL